MEWRDEKAKLLATIRRQEQKTTALARRFRLLQQTLKEQQKLLERYQHALGVVQTASKTGRSSERINEKKRINTFKSTSTQTSPQKHNDSTWIQKKRANSSKESIPESPVREPLKRKYEQTKTTSALKPHASGQNRSLAATWAEEKRRVLKKPKSEPRAFDKENNIRLADEQKSPVFPYIEVVRNREKRKALPGYDCMECKKYYEALGYNEAAAQKNKCSRHRARFEPYQTPDDFWRLSFPDSESSSHLTRL